MSASHDNEPSTALSRLREGARRDLGRIREAYGEGNRNDLRTQERSEALQMVQSVGKPVPMDDVEFQFHLKGAVESLIEGGAGSVEDYCDQRGFAPEDVQKLCQLAMAKLQQLQDRDLDHHTTLARARYEELFRQNKTSDARTALRAQMNLDRVNGVGQTKDVGDTLRSMLEVMKSVNQEDPLFEQDAEEAEFEVKPTQE